MTCRGLPGPGWRLTGIAPAATEGSMANGSSSAGGAVGFSSRCSVLPRLADGLTTISGEDPTFEVPARADVAGRVEGDWAGADFAAADFPADADLAGAAPPFIDAPQNGHSTASS